MIRRPTMTMPFGKHIGMPVRELPDSYLDWLYGLDNLRDPLATAVEMEWEYRNTEPEPPLPHPPAKVPESHLKACRAIVQAGYRTLSLKFHPDQGGDVRHMQHLNQAIEILRRLVG